MSKNIELYFEMQREAERMEKAIRAYYENKKDYAIYCVYVCADTPSGKYFIDVEIGGDANKYRHIKGLYTGNEIRKAYNI